MSVEIIVAIIGSVTTLISPFLALLIRKKCECAKDTPKSICEIGQTPQNKIMGISTFPDTSKCHTKKGICPNCKKTFCEYHLSVNNDTLQGGHICNLP